MSENKAPGPDLGLGIAVEELAEGQMLAGAVAGEPVVLIRQNGRFCAWSGTCTHLGAPLGEGLLADGQIRCPWHHARFSVSSGEAVGAPAFQPLSRYSTAVTDGRVFVSATPTVKSQPPPAKHAGSLAGGAKRVVIIGAGAGGYACAELLGRAGHADAVTLISDDPDPPYDRTQCSKQYLIGMTSRADSLMAPALAAERRTGRAVAIDVGDRSVRLEDGERVPFDVLVLATGGDPVRADMPGFERANVHVLRTLADADALIAAASAARRVAIIGASFIGLEAAASLKQRNLDVHVIAPDAVPLEHVLGAEVGRMIRMVHEEKGVVFHLGRKCKSFDGARLTLDDESTVEADFVVLGLGVRPRTELAEAAGLECASAVQGGGVVVNERLETSVPGIYAIGDIARYPDVHAGKPLRVEHWVHAQRQGQYLARALVGKAGGYRDLPFFWSAHFDTGLKYVGHVGSIAGTRVEGSVEGREFTIGYLGAGEERAFVSCGRDLPALTVEAEWDGMDPVELQPGK
jgi:NADPH-dependent 2,4-dienoyl-CoA reductase/sulfur reductase-like enzyme/nitrite reductase/ring-hydroxylating ferredoxin subunit